MIEFSATMILGHLLGDYIFQPDWQARGKRTSSFIAAAHACTYTVALMLVMGPAVWVLGQEPAPVFLAKMGAVFVTHFLMDRYGLAWKWMNLRWVGQSGFAQDLKPWSVIVVDNTGHLLVLWVLWNPYFQIA
jgi:hypothetical protein